MPEEKPEEPKRHQDDAENEAKFWEGFQERPGPGSDFSRRHAYSSERSGPLPDRLRPGAQLLGPSDLEQDECPSDKLQELTQARPPHDAPAQKGDILPELEA